MDVKEKLVGLISHEVVPYFAERIADHLIANGVTVQDGKDTDVPTKWIPVTERLPEVEGEYITYTDKEQIHFDCFCIYPEHGTRFWVGGNGKITHWMPMPEPPKEG